MADQSTEGTEGDGSSAASEAKTGKSKPTKNLPTDRVGKDTQFSILRAYAKASEEQARGPVSNNEVARFANITPSSISTCNPFWNDAGLLVREGIKQRPADAVFAYDQAAEWGSERPASKLAPILAASWFGKPLLARLSLKPASINEALSFLAEECKAGVEYRSQIQLLLDYLETVGLIAIDGSMVSKISRNGSDPVQSSEGQQLKPQAPTPASLPPPGTKRFSIPIPDKQDAVLILPEDMDEEDWQMVNSFLNTYVNRWKKFTLKKNSAASTGPQGTSKETAP